MTIKDLAALSGYSLGTVSRVLNNQPHVSEKAREQIMAIVKEQGFELNTNARNLKQTHSNNILVIYPEQFGDETPIESFSDPLASDISSTPSPWLLRLRTIATGISHRLHLRPRRKKRRPTDLHL